MLRSVGEKVRTLVAGLEGKSRPCTPAPGDGAAALALSLSSSSGAGGFGALASPGSPMSPSLQALNQDNSAANDAFDAAWAVLHDARLVADPPRLQAFLADGYERDTMEWWDEEVVSSIKTFLKAGGKLKFDGSLKKAMAALEK